MDRREFLGGAVTGLGVAAAGGRLAWAEPAAAAAGAAAGVIKLRPFDYVGVTLLDGPFRAQMMEARAMYLGMSNDDILHGFRRDAGLPAPGKDMTGWCKPDSGRIFGQWVSGHARLGCALNDAALREKAIALIDGWAATMGADGNPRITVPYRWEKLSCGLVDAAVYAQYPRALELLEQVTVWAMKNFDRSRSNGSPEDHDGRKPKGTNEWYTLPENSLRAYQLTGNKTFLEFAKLWYYPEYWDRFKNTTRPEGVEFRHAYSHVNTMSSAAMVYAVTGERSYLKILENAYDYVRQTQCYASGGYGPGECMLPYNGLLGEALETRIDMAEIPCGSWGAIKLARHLITFTGDARYGDWIEALMYNGIGSALPTQSDGNTFYYANYHVGVGTKEYYWSHWPCCSGTYYQCMADYHNNIYFHDDRGGLYVNLAIPSEVAWTADGTAVRLRQTNKYPQEDTTTLTVTPASAKEFAIHVRVPSWCTAAEFRVNGEAVQGVSATPNGWATVSRVWNAGDVLTARFPMTVRAAPVDAQHPFRIAVMYGPLWLAQEGSHTRQLRLDAKVKGDDATRMQAMLARLKRTRGKLEFRDVVDPVERGGATLDSVQAGRVVGAFRPLAEYAREYPYRAYIDVDRTSYF